MAVLTFPERRSSGSWGSHRWLHERNISQSDIFSLRKRKHAFSNTSCLLWNVKYLYHMSTMTSMKSFSNHYGSSLWVIILIMMIVILLPMFFRDFVFSCANIYKKGKNSHTEQPSEIYWQESERNSETGQH